MQRTHEWFRAYYPAIANQKKKFLKKTAPGKHNPSHVMGSSSTFQLPDPGTPKSAILAQPARIQEAKSLPRQCASERILEDPIQAMGSSEEQR